MDKKTAEKLLISLNEMQNAKRAECLNLLALSIRNRSLDNIQVDLDEGLRAEETLARAKATLEHYLQVELGQAPKRKLRRV